MGRWGKGVLLLHHVTQEIEIEIEIVIGANGNGNLYS